METGISPIKPSIPFDSSDAFALHQLLLAISAPFFRMASWNLKPMNVWTITKSLTQRPTISLSILSMASLRFSTIPSTLSVAFFSASGFRFKYHSSHSRRVLPVNCWMRSVIWPTTFGLVAWAFWLAVLMSCVTYFGNSGVSMLNNPLISFVESFTFTDHLLPLFQELLILTCIV